MDKKQILIIEDEAEIREGIRTLLDSEEYTFLEAESGAAGLSMLTEDIDLVILDIMMPGLNGIQVCRKIREISSVPVLFLTAKALETDKLLGLQTGGDDYLTKPFSYLELNARIKSLLRRYCIYRGREDGGVTSSESFLEFDGIRISRECNEVFLENAALNLTEKEYQILLLLMQRPNRPHSAREIYEKIWQEPYFYGASSTIMVHIRNLRNKIEKNPQHPVRVTTVWGKGYQID